MGDLDRTLIWEARARHDGEAVGTFEHGQDPWAALLEAKDLFPEAKFVIVVGEVR